MSDVSGLSVEQSEFLDRTAEMLALGKPLASVDAEQFLNMLSDILVENYDLKVQLAARGTGGCLCGRKHAVSLAQE